MYSSIIREGKTIHCSEKKFCTKKNVYLLLVGIASVCKQLAPVAHDVTGLWLLCVTYMIFIVYASVFNDEVISPLIAVKVSIPL